MGFVGRVGPLSRRDPSPAVYGLLVDSDTAYAELSHQFDQRGWGIVSRDEFAEAIRADCIKGFSTRSPEAAGHKQWTDRQRQRENRQLRARAA